MFVHVISSSKQANQHCHKEYSYVVISDHIN